MRRNASLSDIFAACAEDRKNVVAGGYASWVRRCGVDLWVKMLLLYANSMGRRSAPKTSVYVDEIKNPSMISNLRDTAEIVDGEDASFICLYGRFSKQHVKMGTAWCVLKMLTLMIGAIIPVILFIGSGKALNERMAKLIIGRMSGYVSRLGYEQPYILMSDHHFFSTVIAMDGLATSIVLQHGLIGDLRFFSPVRATYFFAWSEKSASLVDSEKAVNAGTYKFSKLSAKRRDNDCETLVDTKRVLLILSSSKTALQIARRVEPIIALQEHYRFTLLIKVHPGSLFSMDELHNAVASSKIELYKEEKIETLDFDFAFIEQSTAALDVACLGVPFIVIDETPDSYFAEYKGILPSVGTPEELIYSAEHYSRSCCERAYLFFLEREIDSGQCDIDDRIRRLQRKCSCTKKGDTCDR